MNKLIYKPISLGASLLAGAVAGSISKKIWKLTSGEDEAPKATDAQSSWRDVLLSAALQGVVFAVVKAAVDRGAAVGTQKLTGTWPGEGGEQAARDKAPSAA